MSGRNRAVSPEEMPFVPAAGSTSATVFTCALCGERFTHAGLVCSACPLSFGCELVRCPHCGYAFPRASKTVEWARMLFGRRKGDRQ